MTSTAARTSIEANASTHHGRQVRKGVSRALLLVLTVIMALVGMSVTLPASAGERGTASLTSGAAAAERSADRLSGSGSSEYSYTVQEYLSWISGQLEGWWGQWFVANGFITPDTAVYIVEPGQSGVKLCDNVTVTATTNNAYYCSADANGRGAIWLPVTTFQRMWNSDVFERADGRPGDFAAAVIVAHEFGHHVQDELDQQWKAAGYSMPTLTTDNKNVELIADCFAGSFMAGAYYQGILKPGDFEEAETALSVIGDTNPDSPTPHGSSAERVAAFRLGYNSTDPLTCVNSYWR